MKEMKVITVASWWEEYESPKTRNTIYGTFEFDELVVSIINDMQVGAKDQKELVKGNAVEVLGMTIRYMAHKTISIKKRSWESAKVIYNFSNFFRYGSTEKAMDVWGVSSRQELAEALQKAFMEELGVEFTQWFGPGSAAAAILKKEGIECEQDQEWIPGLDYDDRRDLNPFANSYYGAMILTPQYGIYESPVWHGDMNSAFNRAMLDLPKLSATVWEPDRDLVDLDPYGVYFVAYRGPESPSSAIHPLPYRTHLGSEPSIGWLGETSGWYRGVLVNAARRFVAQHGGSIRVIEGWKHTDDGIRPFEFINDLYALRLQLKEENNPFYEVIKPVMQCLYGKLVQQSGDRLGKFFSLKYAGYTTAYVQAAMIDLVSQNPQAILSIQTDGLYSKVPLTVTQDNNLGDFKVNEYGGMMIVGNGRTMIKKEGNWGDLKYRGFKEPSITEDSFRELFSHNPNEEYKHPFKVKIYQGLDTHAGKKGLGKTVSKTFYMDPWGESENSGAVIHDVLVCDGCSGNSSLHSLIAKDPVGSISEDHLVNW